jgi:asparagine synthetase B (glutamine-hydrolysing)
MKNPEDLYQQEHEIRARAGQVMSELKARGEDWQAAWRTHPVAVAYRALLKRAWTAKHQPGPDQRYHFTPRGER